MQEFIRFILSRSGQLITATGEHLSISVIALLTALLIAIPLAIFLSDKPKWAEIILQITSVFQTIPSLAILGLLIPFVGIGTTPAIIALVIYAMLPIFQNTYIGISEIDPSIQEAAEAFGMSRWKKLTKVEIPMAMPFIISGIRTALVLIIGTATLAALIGGGGLGTIILLGIDRNQPMLTLIGAIMSAGLAIAVSTLIRWLSNKNPVYTLMVLAAAGLTIGGSYLYQTFSPTGPTVTIAGKIGAEPDILINLMKEVIESDHPAITVELKPNFGKTSFVFEALDSQEVDVYPEFSGTVLESLVEIPNDLAQDSYDEVEAYNLANELLDEQFDMQMLVPYAYQNTYALVVTQADAEALNIQTISDLQAYDQDMAAGFTLEFINRQDGYLGIQDLYGINFDQVNSMEPALRYQAIANNEVDVIDAYSTDSELRQFNLLTLEDDEQLFPPYQGAALLRQSFIEEHPEIIESLNQLGGYITEDEMIDMNYAVNVEERNPNEVAREFLIEKVLIEEN